MVCADRDVERRRGDGGREFAPAAARPKRSSPTPRALRRVGSLADLVRAKFPRLDIAVTTPGLNIRKTILDYTEEDLDRVVTLNIKGAVYFFQAFGRIMVDQGGGSLIACSSVRAVTIEPGLAVYGCTKAAIGLLVKGFASEVGSFGVRVNAIAPSIAETALTAPFKQRPDIHKLYAAHTVFNRWSSPTRWRAPSPFSLPTRRAMSAAARCSSTADGQPSTVRRRASRKSRADVPRRVLCAHTPSAPLIVGRGEP